MYVVIRLTCMHVLSVCVCVCTVCVHTRTHTYTYTLLLLVPLFLFMLSVNSFMLISLCMHMIWYNTQHTHIHTHTHTHTQGRGYICGHYFQDTRPHPTSYFHEQAEELVHNPVNRLAGKRRSVWCTISTWRRVPLKGLGRNWTTI
jgi:hypothetical protein